MRNEHRIRVLILDESDDDIDSISSSMLKNATNIELVSHSKHRQGVIQKCTELKPDVVIFVPTLHNQDSVDFISNLLHGCGSCQCILVSAPSDPDWSNKVMLAGCRYHLNTSISSGILVDAIQETYEALVDYRNKQ